jgi:hypothetical protein
VNTTRADQLHSPYRPTTYLVSRDGSIVRVAAAGYTRHQRKTWIRLEPISSPAFVITVANDATLVTVTPEARK